MKKKLLGEGEAQTYASVCSGCPVLVRHEWAVDDFVEEEAEHELVAQGIVYG